jgi:DNA-binding response OmpR family regulator
MNPVLVLIIDNSHDTRAMYADYFRHHGFAVAEAATGPEGAALCEQLKPALVITELSTSPEWMDALWSIRSGRGAATPILACSTQIERSAPWGPACVDVALPKPASPRALLDQARALLSTGPTASLAVPAFPA